jgi:hypothetical protein
MCLTPFGAGRTGGVHPERDFVGQRRRRKYFCRSAADEVRKITNPTRHQRGARARVAVDENDCAQPRQAIENRSEDLGQRRGDDNRGRAAVSENVSVLFRRQQRVERQRHNAAAQRSPKGDRKIDSVVEEEREPFLRLESEIGQRRGEIAGTLLQVAVAERTFGIDESDLFRKTASDRRIDEIGDSVIWLALQQVAQHRPASPLRRPSVALAALPVASVIAFFVRLARTRGAVVGAWSFRKTGFHPGSSPGQAFSGSCSSSDMIGICAFQTNK